MLSERGRMLQMKLRELQMKKQHMENLVCYSNSSQCYLLVFKNIIMFFDFSCRFQSSKNCKWQPFLVALIIITLVREKIAAMKSHHANVSYHKYVVLVVLENDKDVIPVTNHHHFSPGNKSGGNIKNEDPFKLMEIKAIKTALQKTKGIKMINKSL